MSDVLRHLRQQQTESEARPRLIHRYGSFLPLTDATPPLSLGEGATPLVQARNLGRQLGTPELYLKLEGCNPTGSFKDRGMVVAVAKALEAGAGAIVCASTGNTAASAAAYGAAAGLETIVVLPAGQIAAGKLVQAQMAGARVVAVDGSFDDALRVVRQLVERGSDLGHPLTLVNSVNPHRLAGQKTAAFEVCEDLGGAPDYLAIPVGNAGNISAYWMGFTEFRDAGMVETRPVMLGFQAEGAAPLVVGREVERPETVATAIRIGRPASGERAIRARDESGGRIEAVSDEEILAAYRDLARHEGVFCEPASAASLAGVRKLVAAGAIDPSGTIVCVLTGHGLKDPGLAAAQAAAVSGDPLPAEASVEAVAAALGW
ncbi:MAG TPA: threonine synthase [Candidatus Limnocylindrales bacterium]|nr:threonine synthase [Candidatus Limnocylindrales bacterium]